MTKTGFKPKCTLVWLLTLIMVLSMLPMNVLADEGGELSIVGGDVCVCESLCDEENVNEDCTVCAEDYVNCAYVDVPPTEGGGEEFPPADGEEQPPADNGGLLLTGGGEGESCICTAFLSDPDCPVCKDDETQCFYYYCICEVVCEEDSANHECPVCDGDYLSCVQAVEAPEQNALNAVSYTLYFKNPGSGWGLFEGDTSTPYTGNPGLWSANGFVLTLKDGFYFETTNPIAFKCDQSDFKIVVENGATATITNEAATPGGAEDCYGIYANSTLSFETGSGVLNVTVAELPSSSTATACGIRSTNLNIGKATVNVSSSAAGSSGTHYGVYLDGSSRQLNLSDNNATLNADSTVGANGTAIGSTNAFQIYFSGGLIDAEGSEKAFGVQPTAINGTYKYKANDGGTFTGDWLDPAVSDWTKKHIALGIPSYRVTYENGDSAVTGNAPVDYDAYADNVTVLDEGDMKNDGKLFAGWSSNGAGSQVTHYPGTTFAITENTTLTAQWVDDTAIAWRPTQLKVRDDSWGPIASASSADEGWDWNSLTRTLTLKNAHIAPTTDSAALALPDDATIVLIGNNIVRGADRGMSYGVAAGKGLTIMGAGSLNAIGGNSDAQINGIYAGGEITINSGTVIATGGTGYSSYGIQGDGVGASGHVTINGGTVITTGGTANTGNSYGIGANGDIVLNGGVLIARSGTAPGTSNAMNKANTGTNALVTGTDNTSNYNVYAPSGMFKPPVTSKLTLTDAANATGNGYAWDKDSLTLTLNGACINVAGTTGIDLPDGANIMLEGVNVVRAAGSGANETFGIVVEDGYGALTIDGSGSLTTVGGNVTNATNHYSFGIFAGDVDVDGGTVTAIGGTVAIASNGQGGSYGISNENLTINDGKITTIGGTVSGGDFAESCGIYIDGFVIEDGSMVAIGGTADAVDSYSDGISSWSDVVINGGNLTAAGGTSSDGNGIYADGIFDMSGGKAFLTGGMEALWADDFDSTGAAITLTSPIGIVYPGDATVDTNSLKLSGADVTHAVLAKATDPGPGPGPKPTPKPTPTPTPTPSGGGGGGGSSAPKNITVSVNGTSSYTATVKDGTMNVNVPASSVNSSIDKLLKDLEENPDMPQVIETHVTGAPDSVGKAEFNLPNGAVSNIVEKTDASLLLDAGKLGSITFDNTALSAIVGAGNGDLRIVIEDITEQTDTKLTDAQKATVGNNSVYDFGVFVGDTRVSEFGLGIATVSIPYTLKSGENPNGIIIYYVDGNGNLQMIPNGVYDEKTGLITFSVNHFSLYMIGHNPKTFTDIAGHWAKNTIELAASRNLVSGIGNGLYDPNRSVSRAEFVQMVQNVVKVPTATNGLTGYADVFTNAWYYDSVVSAKAAGLLGGLITEGNNFLPNQPITREEMAIILANVATYKKANVKGASFDLTKFNDYDAIDSRYYEGLAFAIKLGLMSEGGMGSGNFEPKGLSTRAQAAQIQANILNILK